METFTNFQYAEEAAKSYFAKYFNNVNGVGIKTAFGNEVHFFSKNDIGMSNIYTCVIKDGFRRYSENCSEIIKIPE